MFCRRYVLGRYILSWYVLSRYVCFVHVPKKHIFLTWEDNMFQSCQAYMCQTRMAGIVDVVYVNIITWYLGCERVRELAKGGPVVSRPGTRVDGYSYHEQRSWFSK
jgi:hypothetical protein